MALSCSAAVPAEKMDPFEIKGKVQKGYGLYNLLLEYEAFERSCQPKTFNMVGYSPLKKPESQSNLPLRQFVISPSDQKIEITTSNGIYFPSEQFRNYRTENNQPYGTTLDFFVYQFTPSKNDTITKDSLEAMLNEFNGFLKKRCKFIDRTIHAPPFHYQLKQEKHTTADAYVIISSDTDYLNELNRAGIGKISGNALVISTKALPQLPANWSISKSRISHAFPWRSGVPIPKTTPEGVWMWCGAVRWVWQTPDGWCLPQFFR